MNVPRFNVGEASVNEVALYRALRTISSNAIGNLNLVVDTTTISSGTNGYLLFNNNGVLGQINSALFVKADGTIPITGLQAFSSGLSLAEQAAPSTPTNKLVLYADTSNRLSWKGENGFVRTFDGTANTADRIYTLPDSSGTVSIKDSNGIISTTNFLEGYTTTATAGATTTLTVSSNYLQFFTGTSTQTVQLPVVSTLTLGQQFYIRNNSTGLVTITSSGGNTVRVLGSGTRAIVTCISTSGTDATSWSTMYVGINITDGKVLSVSNSLTLAGTDGTTLTFPANGIASAATPSSVVSRDSNGNTNVVNCLEGYTSTATSGGTTTLTVSSNFDQYFTGTLNQTLVLPVASTLANGQSWWITNLSTGAITVQTSGGNTLLTIGALTNAIVTCVNTSGGTGTASWSSTYFGSVVASGKVLTVNNTITFTGTDGTTMTLPSTSSTLAPMTKLYSILGTQFGNGVTVAASTSQFAAPFFGASLNNTETNRDFVIPFACTIQDLYVRTSTSQPSNNSCIIMVRKNTGSGGADTTLTTTIAANATANTFTDLTHSFSCAKGDRISFKIQNQDNASASATIMYITCSMLAT